MESSLEQIIEECARTSYAGTSSFGEVVSKLAKAGVESYHADYRLAATTYYFPNGETHTLVLSSVHNDIPQDFNVDALRSAIRGAQRGEVKYPHFLELSAAAGCIGYIVWIEGKHVSYFGRRGEVHVEQFPSTK